MNSVVDGVPANDHPSTGTYRQVREPSGPPAFTPRRAVPPPALATSLPAGSATKQAIRISPGKAVGQKFLDLSVTDAHAWP